MNKQGLLRKKSNHYTIPKGRLRRVVTGMKRFLMPLSYLSPSKVTIVVFFCAVCLVSGLIRPLPGAAAQDDHAAAANAAPAAAIENHKESIEVTINTETASNADLKVRLSQAEAWQKSQIAELHVYNVQLSAYGNLLMLPQTTAADMEKARIDTLNARDAIAGKLKDISETIGQLSQLSAQTKDQLSLNEKQLSDITASGASDTVSITLKKNLQTLIALLNIKQKRIEKIEDIYNTLKQQLGDTQNSLSDVADKLNRQVELKKKAALFQRSASPLLAFNPQQLKEELHAIVVKILKPVSADFWKSLYLSLKDTTGLRILLMMVPYIGILWGLLRFRTLYRRSESNWRLEKTPWRFLLFGVLDKSLILTGTTIFLTGYINLQTESVEIATWKIIYSFLWLWLLTQWGILGVRTWKLSGLPGIPDRIQKGLCFGLRTIRCFGVIYLGLEWLLDGAGSVLLLARMLFGVGLLVEYIHFWRSVKPHWPILSDKYRHLKPVLAGLGYIIAGLGPVLELVGYGYLALYWYTSWGITLIVCGWAGILMMAIREWQKVLAASHQPGSHHTSDRHTLQWLSMRLLWAAWFPVVIIAVMMAWGAKHAVILGFFKVINYPLPIGDLRLSILGFACAALLLLLTHFSTRLWRRMLREKFLSGSGMEPGLKDSISAITVYLLWALGIFVSLRVVGVSSTSLTVVFGALSIGLGFGIQNIFNNFISGIILLFERPIQIGDAVEINGVWGVVQKINVRSTLVQTYDNASLIIPNSEFISNKVINWSFKDHRIRRIISVGVAYGSDTALVSSTLLEIARKTQWVLTEPAPDVLFADFGDSALIFKLRVWTLVDHMARVETQIRFDIERLFRERHIEMPFPQHDVHIVPIAGETS